MITIWEPITARVVHLPEWDARGSYLRMQDAAPVALTLAVKEHLRGRRVRCQDAPGEPWYCLDCLADLPGEREGQDAHECGQQAQAPPVEHKTRTTQPTGYVYDSGGSRRTDKRGRLMYDKGSFAVCSCGWVAAGGTREEARWRAREHRQEAAREAVPA